MVCKKGFQFFCNFFRCFALPVFLLPCFSHASVEDSSASELPIVVIITSYNNRDCCVKNIDSILAQNHKNLRVIFIDDCSEDGTGKMVTQRLKEKGQEHRVTFFRNAYNKKKLANLYKAIHLCDDDEIIVEFDGDDELVTQDDEIVVGDTTFALKQALPHFNNVFSDPNVWVTWAQFKNHPKEIAEQYGFSEIGVAGAAPEGSAFRTNRWVYSGLRAYRAWLAKHIKLEDFIGYSVPNYVGKFYPTSSDGAIMYPALEMSYDPLGLSHHFKFIPEILLLRNVGTPLNDFKIGKAQQIAFAKESREKDPYVPLKEPVIGRLERLEHAAADLVVFSYRRPATLFRAIESYQKQLSGLRSIFVFYYAEISYELELLEKFQKRFPSVKFIRVKQHAVSLETMRNECLSNCGEHVIFAHGNYEAAEPASLSDCIRELERTWAFGFYFQRNLTDFDHEKEKLGYAPVVELSGDLCAWKFRCASFEGESIANLDMTLYRKEDVLSYLSTLEDKDLMFEEAWNSAEIDPNKVGLFFAKSPLRVME